MEQNQVETAVKTMLQKTNTNQSLKVYTKAEPKPKFINSTLQPYYEKTDLTLKWVYDCCKTLKPLKGIDVNEMQVQFWYIEFIKMGWMKKDFDKQFEAIKRATLYGRIDLESWIKTEIMYNEIDFNVKLKEAIENRILQGKALKERKVECGYTDEEKEKISLYEADLIKRKYERDQLEANEDWVKKERIRIKKSLFGIIE